MTSNKYRDKVRKLFALAESSNPHEAERALAQAKKIMAKYNIKTEDTEIVTVESSNVPRPYLKDFETHMVGCVNAVSGCEAYMRTTSLPGGKVKTIIHFVGTASDANMAAYSFEVLHNQVRLFQLDLKKKDYTPPERNRASLAWSIAACEKLNEFFDYKEVPEAVRDYFERESKDFNDTNFRKSEKVEDEAAEKDNELLREGYQNGQKARLNKAATHQSHDILT